MEAMRKEFARLSGRCWIESDRRGKQEVINEAKLKGEEVHFSMVHGIIGEKVMNSHREIPVGNIKGEP